MLQGSVTKVDSANSASGLYSFNSKGSGFIHSLVSFFYSGVGAAAIPARLRLRKNFGERAFSPAAVLVSVSFYIFLCYKVLFFYTDEGENDALFEGIGTFIFYLIPVNAFTFFIIKTVRLAYLHFKEIYSYSENKSYKYSFYRGDPINDKYSGKIGETLFGYTVDESVIRIYYEPKEFAIKYLARAGLCLAAIAAIIISTYEVSIVYSLFKNKENWLIIVAIFWLFSYLLSCLSLSFSGFCLLVEELSIAKKIRDTVLDMVDGEYDMQFVLKQKELLETPNGSVNGQSLDLAESIFQNPEMANMASFPKMEYEPTVNVASLPNTTHVVEKKNELVAALVREQKPVQKITHTPRATKKAARPGEVDRPDIPQILLICGIVIAVCCGGYVYHKHGLLPFTTYTVNQVADVSPVNSQFTLKTVEGGFNSTVLNFEVTNTGADTLKFPFLDPTDQRAIKLEAPTIFTLVSFTSIPSSEDILRVGLSTNQEFGNMIVVPPYESRSYAVKFGNYSYKGLKQFSIRSEDKTLNQTYLLFKKVALK